VGRHHAAHPRVDGGGERRQVAGPVRRLVDVDHRQRDVGVDPGGAVSREVLGAGGHPAGLQSTDERRAVPRHQLGVGAERPLADHSVVWLGAHVDHGRQHHVDAEVAGAGPEAGGDPGGRVGVVERAQRRVPGPG
jgi:hypothetical protein